MTMSCDDTGTSGVQRFEVFTGAGKRRDWPPEVKASIIAESYSGAETVSAVARRHGLAPSQLFTWRRMLRKQMEEHGFTVPAAVDQAPSFVPAVVDVVPEPVPAQGSKLLHRRRRGKASAVELEVDGITVKIGRGADADTISAVISALRAAR